MIANSLRTAPFADKIQWRSRTPITKRPVKSSAEAVHTQPYIHKVQEIASTGGGDLNSDTPVSPRSYDVALLAVSAWLDGVDIVRKTGKPACFCVGASPRTPCRKDYRYGFLPIFQCCDRS
ncbi:Deacetylases, including yeast histone deacetylase and acetoin utilization protein [Richelia intracellularis]|nr:Deacetylases, including yeast histone deacetylase and acetoin utilization protein [Richelia intracellularis]